MWKSLVHIGFPKSEYIFLTVDIACEYIFAHDDMAARARGLARRVDALGFGRRRCRARAAAAPRRAREEPSPLSRADPAVSRSREARGRHRRCADRYDRAHAAV